MSQRAYLLGPGDRVKGSSIKCLQESLTPLLPYPLSGAPNFRLFLPSCCCAWPGPTSPLTLTSEPSYKYALSILVTFPKKFSQVINTPAICLTGPPYQPGWVLGGRDRLGGRVRREKKPEWLSCPHDRSLTQSRVRGQEALEAKVWKKTDPLFPFYNRQSQKERELILILCLF